MAKRKYTVTLDPDIVEAVRSYSDNFSLTVTTALKQLIADHEKARLVASLKAYDKEAVMRREKTGLFSDQSRKFS